MSIVFTGKSAITSTSWYISNSYCSILNCIDTSTTYYFKLLTLKRKLFHFTVLNLWTFKIWLKNDYWYICACANLQVNEHNILTYGVGWHDWCSGQNSQKQFMVIVFWMAGINTICKGLFEVCGICKFKGNIFLGKL